MEGSKSSFKVTITSKEVVSAPLPPQEHWLPLSNLDLLLPPLDVGIFICYRKPNGAQDFTTTVSELKESLSKTLVTYYPFAGEMVTNSIGEPELLCNNRGVDFVVARADVRMVDLNLHDPDESVEVKLVPVKVAGVLSVQVAFGIFCSSNYRIDSNHFIGEVTELNCGGIIVGCSFDHRVADAHSTNMFLISWSETTGAKPASTTPSFRRSQFYPRRRPGIVHDASINRHYVPLSSLPPPISSTISDQTINRIYHVSAANIDRMQSLASTTAKKSTKLESFCAFFLHTIAKCTTATRIKSCSMGVVVNGRSRLSGSFFNYFGNVLSVPHVTLTIDKIADMEVHEVAETVHKMIKDTATEDHFLGLIDWVESRRPEPAVTKVYCVEGEERVAFVVSSGLQFPVRKLDFGWGRPVFGSYHFPWGGHAGYVMPMPSVAGNGDWFVYMNMKRWLLMEVEAEICNVLRPLAAEHLVFKDLVWN